MLDCREEGLDPEDFENVPYPHAYIQVWIWCQKYKAPGGASLLPEPEKGPLDQDADMMLAFEALEEISKELEEEEEMRERTRKLAAESGFGTG